MPNEFKLIDQYFRPLCGPEALSLKDDAACFTPPDGFDLVITKDLLLEGVHFRSDDPVETIGGKALAVNVSDCVAKGATPHLYWLGLALPDGVDNVWLAKFSDGLNAAQSRYACHLAGGDTTKSPKQLAISITLIGLVPTGKMVGRGGAKIGDDVYITGTLGDGAFGLWCLENNELGFERLISSYRQPCPAVQLGARLTDVASASADVSDGLIADAGHIANTSGLQITLWKDRLPLSKQAGALLDKHEELEWMRWAGGDDYQIVFTAAKEHREKVDTIASSTKTQISRIGTTETGSGVQLLDKHGEILQVTHKGYTHF